MEIVVKRVVYAKRDTPEELREYGINGVGPVGTKSEWKRFVENKGHTVTFQETD